MPDRSHDRSASLRRLRRLWGGRSAIPLMLVLGITLPLGSLSLDAQVELSVSGTTAGDAPTRVAAPILETQLSARGAQVTRGAEVPAQAGIHTLSVGPLPPRLVSDSVAAEGDAHLRVLSVQVEKEFGEERGGEELLALERRFDTERAEKAQLERRLESVRKRQTRFQNLRVVPPRRAPDDISPPSVDPEQWTAYLDFVERGLTESATQIESLERELEIRAIALQRLMDERRLISLPDRDRSIYLNVTVQNTTGAAGTVRVKYEVLEALWYPEYTVEVNPDTQRLIVSFYGVAHQATGEDWPSAPVRFSTALAHLGATMPELASFRIRRERFEESDFARAFSSDGRLLGAVSADARPVDLEGTIVARRGRPELRASRAREGRRSFGDNIEKQSFDLGGRHSRARTNPPKVTRLGPVVRDLPRDLVLPSREASRGFLRTYTSQRPEAVPGDGGPHRLLIAQFEMPYFEERRVAPELSTWVYRQIRAPLGGDDPLLAGGAAIFSGGAYLGRSRLPTTAPGEEIRLDLGVDPQLACVRRVEEREENVGVFTKSRKYFTEVTIELQNLHDRPAQIDCSERIPFSEEERIDIRISRDTTPEPLRIVEAAGLIDWSIGLAPGEKKTVRLIYTIEAPRDWQLSLTPAPGRMEVPR